jgi:hypothetical protein
MVEALSLYVFPVENPTRRWHLLRRLRGGASSSPRSYPADIRVEKVEQTATGP